jgi:choline transport protein
MARDDALICSAWLGQIHPKFGVPVWALVANSSVVFIIGCIYLGSSTAFNAMIGTGLILQQLSYAFPTALLMFRRRSRAFLPANRYIKLGIFGWIANFTTVAFAIIVGVFYNFPSTMPVAASNMNYASVVLGAMAIFTLMNWFVHAKRQYKGPRLPDELMLHET